MCKILCCSYLKRWLKYITIVHEASGKQVVSNRKTGGKQTEHGKPENGMSKTEGRPRKTEWRANNDKNDNNSNRSNKWHTPMV